MGSTFGIFVLALTIASAAQADRKGKANCHVELIKEASASSIQISFEADSQEECDRAKGPEVQTNFSGPAPQPVPTELPSKKK